MIVNTKHEVLKVTHTKDNRNKFKGILLSANDVDDESLDWCLEPLAKMVQSARSLNISIILSFWRVVTIILMR